MPSACAQCGAFVIPPGDDFEVSVTTVPRTLARFSKLAATNEPAHDTELAILRPIVEKTTARLASLDAEISRLTDRLRELEEERSLLLQYHAQNTGIFSALRQVPIEILGEIFSHTLPATRFVFDGRSSPWSLTHVCSRWRDVALSKPSLWSLISFDFSVQEKYPSKLVRMQIERARSLEIHFIGSQDGDTTSQIALFGILAEYSGQWEALGIQMTSHLVPCLTSLRRNLAALRRVWVTWDTAQSQPPDLDAINFFDMAISLIDIGVWSQYRFVPSRLPTPSRLTRYDFDAPWSTHCELLKSLSNLEEVRIRCYFDEDEQWPESGEPIDLPHLRRLYITPSTVLEYLMAPILEEIVIWGHVEDSQETCDDFERFLIRSSCSPRCLRLRGLLDHSMAKLLQKYPSFTEVVAIDADEDKEHKILSAFLTFFSNSTSSAPVLPQITRIGFACRHTDAILYPLLLNMVESWWNAGQCALNAVEVACLDSPVSPDPQSVARIGKLQEAGLQILMFTEDEAQDRATRWFLTADWI